MNEVPIASIHVDQIEAAIGPQRYAEFQETTIEHRNRLNGAIVWHINSTARGGGVAEMLQSLLAYARGLDIETRWLVIGGNPAFFDLTKRLHNNLHGHAGDGGPLGEAEQKIYLDSLAESIADLPNWIRPRDIVVCHDPQTAGLIPAIRKIGARVIWRCHIGNDKINELMIRSWEFLAPHLREAQRYVFTREAFIPDQIDRDRTIIIPPSIDPLSPKNQPMSRAVVESILVKTGIVESADGHAEPCFTREDGSKGVVERCADVMHLGRPPALDRPLIVQVSRWDQLKDPIGVMRGFTQYLSNEGASLVLVGPNVSAVADDPEGGKVLDMVETAWRELPHETRKHVHIACLPMTDREENAAIVNAIQRHATIIVQKSLFEGFGLTVTEAMWKGTPVVASAVGGIQDQIVDGEHGLLVRDPTDLQEFAGAVGRLLHEPDFAKTLSANARRRVDDNFLFTRHLRQYLDLFDQLCDDAPSAVA